MPSRLDVVLKMSLKNIENHLFITAKKSKFIVQNRIEIIYGLSSFSTTIYYFIYILAGAGRKVFQFCFATSEIAPASSFILTS